MFDKLKMHSPDFTAANIDKIAALFPNCVTEKEDADGKIARGINFERLKQELSTDVIEHYDECYDFTWVGKNAAIAEGNEPAYIKYNVQDEKGAVVEKKTPATLRPCVEESKNWEDTENLYIEGDNLTVLKLLQESYLNSIKMIYIDPPYNTGKDFIYKDNRRQTIDEYEDAIEMRDDDGLIQFTPNLEANPQYHSDWCSMMYPRLRLAKNLLADDGVVFISIDDGELSQMRKICDEIFGLSNFRNTILTRRRIKSLNSQFASNGLYSMNVGFEYVLVYAKSNDFTMRPLRMKKVNASEKGRWDVFWSNADRPTMRYEVLGFTPETGQWRNSKEKADVAVKNYKLYQEQFESKMPLEEYWQETGSCLSFIRRISPGSGKNGGVQHWIPPSDTALRTSNWTDIEVSQIHKEIDLPFENPKARELIQELIKLSDADNGDVILDFFSGSATTAHAVMQLNADDGGSRKFIMVQLPEPCDEKSEAFKAGYKNICEIGKERIRRAGDKINAKIAEDNAQLKLGEDEKTPVDIGFRVFKTDTTNMKDVYYAAGELKQEQLELFVSNIKEERSDLDLLYGVLIDWGLPLSMKHKIINIDGYQIHDYDDLSLVACFEDNVPETLVREIAKMQPLRVVFKDGSFESSPHRLNVEEIFKLNAPNTSVKVI